MLFALLAASLTAQEGSMEEAVRDGVGFVTVCNATGLAGELQVRVNGKNPIAGVGYVSGDDTGQIGLAPGPVRIEVAHKGCANVAKVDFPLTNEQNAIIVAYVRERIDPETKEVTYQLGMGQLPHKPSPGETRVTFFACDPDGKIGGVKVNQTPLELPPLKPVRFVAEVEDSLVVRGVNGGELEPYLLADPEHYYCVVFPTIGKNEIQGTWFVDEKVSYSLESEIAARRFVEEQRAKERKAMEEWKKRQEEKRARLRNSR